MGAILGGADDRQRASLRDYGMNLGIAFQIADDILDITSDADQLGKPTGSDLLEGKLTLPLIALLEEAPEMRPIFERIMLEGTYSEISRDEIKARLRSSSILDDVRARARSYISSARKSIDVLPETRYRSSLEGILTFVIDRSS